MTKNKNIGIGLIGVIAVAIVLFIGVQLNKPAYSFKLDVNPSIEIVSSRFDKVLEVNPLNEDAKEMLKDFQIKDSDLDDTIEDLADLMVLSGYISGGKDNIVMITVDDKTENSELVNKLNQAIKAYLENKQIEATILNQTISQELGDKNTGSELFANKLTEVDGALSYEDLQNMTLRELFELAEARNIDLDKLFSSILAYEDDSDDRVEEVEGSREFIGEAKAKEIALGLVDGEIVKFELDDFDDDGDDDPEYEIKIIANGFKYEIELDAYTGKLVGFDKDDIDDDDMYDDDDDDLDDYYDDDYDDDDDRVTSTPKETIAPKVDDNNDRVASTPKATTAATVAPTEAPKVDIDNTKKTSKPASRITKEQAQSIALERTGGGRIVDFELDDDKYEIEIIGPDNREYEIDIHAYTGKIVDFDVDDYDDDYDDDDDNDDDDD